MRIVGRDVEYRSPWLEVVRKRVEAAPDAEPEDFYAIRVPFDYVVVLAVTDDDRIPLVRQFRPALELTTLELPSGAIDAGESPEASARRELLEETGCKAATLEPLGPLYTDAGRAETKQWGFFAPAVREVRAPDPGEQLETLFVAREQLGPLIADGTMRLALHVAVVGCAVARGLLVL